MVLFFINGALQIIKCDYLPEDNSIDFYEYKMRFLTESTSDVLIKITMLNDDGDKLEFEEMIVGLRLIELDCTPFMERFNRSRKSYMRINYIVSGDCLGEPLFGSFPIVSPAHDGSLRIGAVSCN